MKPAAIFRAGVFWLTVITLILLVLAYQMTLPQRIDVGIAGDELLTRGLYFAEQQGDTTFRWSGPEGEIRFDGVGARPWTLHMRLSGLRPQGPALLRVTANGRPLAELSLGGEMAEYALEILRDAFGPDGNTRIGLATDTFTAPPDARELGVMVDWVELRPEGFSLTIPPWLLLLSLTLCAVMLSRGIQAASGSTLTALVGGVACALAFAAGIVWGRLQLGILLPWLLAGTGAAWVIGKRIRQAAWWEWLFMIALLVAGYRFLDRCLDFYRFGSPMADFQVYYDAAKNLRLGLPLYDFAAAVGMPNGPVFKYPPLFAIMLAPFTGWPMEVVYRGYFLVLLGLLGMTGYLLTFRLAQRPGVTVATYLVPLGILVFQPAWESLIRGQLDIIVLAVAVVALIWLRANRMEALAGSLISLVTMFKLYPALLMVYLLVRRRWRALIGFGLTFLVLILLSGVIVGWETLWRYAGEILVAQTEAVPWPENQSYDGFISRLVVPSADTTWFTTLPLPLWARLALYALDLLTLGITALILWRGADEPRRFGLGYVVVMPLVILMWPTAWIHYQTLLLLPFAFLAHEQVVNGRPVAWIALLVSFLPVAMGNEYLVLIPALQEGPARLLQSYKLYGVLILWLLLLWHGRVRQQPHLEPEYA